MSGACRCTRSSQLCRVSSIAAHSSPRGFTSAAANAAAGTRVSTLPKPSRPSALARRRAGSTVSTEHAPAVTGRGHGAPSAAAVVVLPTPPGAAAHHDLLRREQLLDRAHATACCPPSVAQLRGQRGRRPCGSPAYRGCAGTGRARRASGPARSSSARSRSRCSALPRRSATAKRGGVHEMVDVAAGFSDVARRRSSSFNASKQLLFAAPEQLGQHPVDDDGREIDVRLVFQARRPARASR